MKLWLLSDPVVARGLQVDRQLSAGEVKLDKIVLLFVDLREH